MSINQDIATCSAFDIWKMTCKYAHDENLSLFDHHTSGLFPSTQNYLITLRTVPVEQFLLQLVVLNS